MSQMKEVSLGFAEFVSQLIHETFDAVMSSQQYQIEKYTEIQQKLDLSSETYRSYYISDKEVKEQSFDYFGFEITPSMKVTQEIADFLQDNFESQNLITGSKLTKAGYEAINDFIAELIITEQKGLLSTLLNGSNATRLIIDSGQIIAKLELANLYSTVEDEKAKPIIDTNEHVKLKDKVEPLELQAVNKSINLSSLNKPIPLEEVETDGKYTVLINKDYIKDLSNHSQKLPNVRLAVTPTKLNSTSDLFAEIKINFKTI